MLWIKTKCSSFLNNMLKFFIFFNLFFINVVIAQPDFEKPENYRVKTEFVNPYDRIQNPPSNEWKVKYPIFLKPSIEKDYSKSLSELIFLHQHLSTTQKEIEGYRIQILSTMDQNAIKKARMDFSELNTSLKIYQVYDRPYYKLRVGDFLTKFEAEQMVYVLLKNFPAAFVVPDKIKIN